MYQDATNLFARLSRYSLKPKKSPLENFCTELLAWCLQKSVGFQSEFLKLIQLDFLKNLKGAIEIRTQQYWIDKEDDQDENGEADEDHKERPRGFFDLEFQSPQDLNGQGELFIAIESKIGADFKPGQLPKYRAELAKRGANYNHCYLITLTTRSKKPDLAHAHIKWSQVQELLTKVPVEEKLDIIYKQFADFLKQKGIAPMKIKKIDSEVLKGWSNCFDCQRDLWRILDNVRKSEELKASARNRHTFAPDDESQSMWLGIATKGTPLSPLTWFGFEFSPIDEAPQLLMIVEGQFTKDITKEKLKRLLVKTETLSRTVENNEFEHNVGRDGTFVRIRQPVDAQYNGDAEKICEWLRFAAKEFSELRPK